jgi:hypothetical protein
MLCGVVFLGDTVKAVFGIQVGSETFMILEIGAAKN